MTLRSIVLVVVLASGLVPAQAADPVSGLKLPDGFVVHEFVGPQLANDIYTLHIDSTGRVVVCGRGYVRELLDIDGDGRADRARELVTGVKDGPMGVLWEGETLYVVADGGLKRYRGVDGTKPVSEAETILLVRTGGEHDAHAVRRGPDGWLYLICGNMAGVTKKLITSPQSPVKDPVAGALVRISPDGKQVEVVADGFRNAYGFDFNEFGDVFTYDSDNERCVGLPWYEPTRFYHVVPGSNHGWMSPQHAQTWRRPPYFFDVTPPVCTLGRGSPTGVVCYRHTHYPAKYRGGFFLADWTFGKVWFVPLARAGSTYAGKPEVFLEATGEDGFAPTGLAVHPTTGELFVSIGGRGTRGAVYCISYPARLGQGKAIPFTPRAGPAAARPAPPASLDSALRTLASDTGPVSKLNAVRAVQLALGDLTSRAAIGGVFEGYTLRKQPTKMTAVRVADALRKHFSTGHRDLNRELSRTLAALGDANPATTRLVVGRLTDASDPLDDIHYLIVLARLPTPLAGDEVDRVATAFLELDRKLTRAGHTRDRNWPLRIAEAASALIRTTPALAHALVDSPRFGRPEHALFATLDGVDRAAAARRFLRASTGAGFEWTPAVVELLGALPDAEVRPVLAKLWDRGDLTDALLPLFARSPVEADRGKFLTGLGSVNAGTVGTSAKALARLPSTPDGAELVAAVMAVRRTADGKPETAAHRAVVRLLRARTGQQFTGAKDWEAWLTRERPDLAKSLVPTAYDPAAWRKRLAAVEWTSGDPAAGRRVYSKAQCAACHDGSKAVGPPLQGVTKRFGRDDLLTAVLDPGRDVPPRYRPTRFATTDGKTHDGVVVYEAVDGVILQTGPDATVRIAGARIESRRSLTTSLMPAGLLDPLTVREIADLIAYLKSLDAKPASR
ncbi:MAG TPA: c-type cytochrome [Fimbriiglobus sp.]|nr:c-type cytochrome [Fimbriiglobus sp.]